MSACIVTDPEAGAGYETEQEKQRAGEGATGAADRAAAAEAATGRDSQGEHPEPLYLPGRHKRLPAGA